MTTVIMQPYIETGLKQTQRQYSNIYYIYVSVNKLYHHISGAYLVK